MLHVVYIAETNSTSCWVWWRHHRGSILLDHFLSVEYQKRQSTLYVVVYRLFKQELVIDVDIVSVALRFR